MPEPVSDFAKALARMEKRRDAFDKIVGPLKEPIAVIAVSREGMALDVCLDRDNYQNFGEHIPGEGADISLKRLGPGGKVCGAHLPLYAKTLLICGHFPSIRIDLETGIVSIDQLFSEFQNEDLWNELQALKDAKKGWVVSQPEPIEVTSNPIAISVEETVTALCEDMKKMHWRLVELEERHDEELDLGCGGEGSQ